VKPGGGGGSKGHTSKHSTTSKHTSGKSSKHSPAKQKKPHQKTANAGVQTVGTAAKPPAKLKLAAGGEVACCAAESLAASIRVAGGSVADDAVLALYAATAADPDEGQSLRAALRAACRRSLGGYYPAFEPVAVTDPRAVLLGTDLPGPHAVCVGTDGCWWSWGQDHDPAEWPGAVILEAWAVTWR
jgi:hypothetical protein